MDTYNLIATLAVGSVVVILVAGLAIFARGGKVNHKYGNKMMRLRIAAQFVAILIILLLIFLRSQGAEG